MKHAHLRRAFLAVALPAICSLTTTSFAQDCPPEESCKDWIRGQGADGFWHDPDGENWGPPGPPGSGDTARHLTQGNAIVVGSGLDDEICKDFIGDGDDPDHRFLEILSGNTLTVERKIETAAESLEPFVVRLEDGEPGNPTTLRVGAQQRAEGQVPEGFEMVVLRTTTAVPWIPDINDRSQVVWSESDVPPGSSNVYLWTEGQIVQITDDTHFDRLSSINNSGDIAWQRRDVPKGQPWKLVVWINGESVSVPGDPPCFDMPVINDLGHVAFNQCYTCYTIGDASDTQLFLFNGKSVQQLTGSLANLSPEINIHDDIVWTRWDYTESPRTGTIMLYAGGVIHELTDGMNEDGGVDINDLGQVVWREQEGTVILEEPGEDVTTVITDNGRVPRINNSADITFTRFNFEDEKWDIWLHKGGQFYKLPDFGYSVAGARLNNNGELVVRGFNFETGINAILMLRRCEPPDGPSCTDDAQCEDGNPCTEGRCECGQCAYAARLYGDVNDDETVDLSDILCVLDAFQGDSSTCAMSRADIGPCIPDGIIDLLDIFNVLDAFAGQDPCCG